MLPLLQACRTLSLFPPDDCVKTAVRFSKLLYAMLIREPFAPPKNSGFILPSRSHSDFKSYELGMKVVSTGSSSYMACGNEIIYALRPMVWRF